MSMIRNHLRASLSAVLLSASFSSFFYPAATFAFEWNQVPVYLFGKSSEAPPQEAAQAPSSPEQGSPSGASKALQQQLSQIDLEILLLRSELALQNGDLIALQKYLDELGRLTLPPAFAARFQELTQALGASNPNPILRFLSFESGFEFPMHDPKAVVAIVLPFSGKYADVSSQLLQSLKETLAVYGFEGQIVEFDSMRYANAFELWERLKQYQPSFIFGPLQKELIAEWHSLDTRVPTLYFNDVQSTLFAYEKALSPAQSGQVRKVALYLSRHGFEQVLVLANQDPKTQELSQALQLFWNASDQLVQISVFPIEENVSLSLAKAFGVEASENRAKVLQKIVRRPVEIESRSRQDVQALISLAEPSSAIQISPILEFYQLDQVQHFWFPSKSLKNAELSLYQNTWQSTTGFLPAYQVEEVLSSESLKENQSGIFYALGQVAIEIANQAEFLAQKDWILETPYGQVEANRNGQFYLLPTAYWLDKGEMASLEKDAE